MASLTTAADWEGRLGAVFQTGIQNAIGTAAYDLFGVSQVTLGSGESDTYTHDGNSGRMTDFAFSIIGTSPYAGSLTWNANGTLGQRTSPA